MGRDKEAVNFIKSRKTKAGEKKNPQYCASLGGLVWWHVKAIKKQENKAGYFSANGKGVQAKVVCGRRTWETEVSSGRVRPGALTVGLDLLHGWVQPQAMQLLRSADLRAQRHHFHKHHNCLWFRGTPRSQNGLMAASLFALAGKLS